MSSNNGDSLNGPLGSAFSDCDINNLSVHELRSRMRGLSTFIERKKIVEDQQKAEINNLRGAVRAETRRAEKLEQELRVGRAASARSKKEAEDRFSAARLEIMGLTADLETSKTRTKSLEVELGGARKTSKKLRAELDEHKRKVAENLAAETENETASAIDIDSLVQQAVIQRREAKLRVAIQDIESWNLEQDDDNFTTVILRLSAAQCNKSLLVHQRLPCGRFLEMTILVSSRSKGELGYADEHQASVTVETEETVRNIMQIHQSAHQQLELTKKQLQLAEDSVKQSEVALAVSAHARERFLLGQAPNLPAEITRKARELGNRAVHDGDIIADLEHVVKGTLKNQHILPAMQRLYGFNVDEYAVSYQSLLRLTERPIFIKLLNFRASARRDADRFEWGSPAHIALQNFDSLDADCSSILEELEYRLSTEEARQAFESDEVAQGIVANMAKCVRDIQLNVNRRRTSEQE